MGLFRYLLAAAVVWTHAHNPSYPGLLNAGVAVTSFFMISGFYMGLILETKYGSHTRVFYLSRFLRIYPLYYLTLAFALAILVAASLWQGNWADRLAFYAHAWDAGHGFLVSLLVLVQMALVGIDLPCLFSYTETGPRLLPLGGDFGGILLERMLVLPQAWTIGFEVLFYLCVPWIRRWRTKTLLLVAAFSFALKMVFRILSPEGESSKWEYQFFPPQCVFFLLGFLAYRHREWISGKMPPARLLAGLLVLLGMFFAWPQLPAAGTDLVWWGLVFFALPGLFQATRSSRLDSLLGSLSYPLYLIHVPIRWLLLGPGGSYGAALSPLLLLLVSTLASVGLALVFENRLESWRARSVQRLLSLQRPANQENFLFPRAPLKTTASHGTRPYSDISMNPPRPSPVSADWPTLIRSVPTMGRDLLTFRYRKWPTGTLLGAFLGVAYLVNPLDLIPDALPGIGIIDDAFVFGVFLTLLSRDVKKYLTWRNAKGKSNHPS